jgi:hypothetical protein
MKLVIGVIALIAALSACGSAASQPSPATGTGFHNMSALEKAITVKGDQNFIAENDGNRLTSVVCMLTSTNIAHCNFTNNGPDGENESSGAIYISPDGTSWMAGGLGS